VQIYFDSCCLNRPYDDLGDCVIRMESEAILSIVDRCETGDWSFFSSDALDDELLNMENYFKRERVLLLYRLAGKHITLNKDISSRAIDLKLFGISSYDALHIASAELGGADIFLTTDYRLINAAKKAKVNIPVMNPLIWFSELLYDRKP